MTPSKTPFAGFERLAPGDPLSSDAYSFQSENPLIADALAKIGAVTHRHDAHAAMANPTTAPVVAVPATGGSIPASTSIHVAYTLLDGEGGESLPVTPVVVTTAAGYATPASAPTAAADYTAGTMLAGTPLYAVTVTDGAGGETALGPVRSVTVDPGHANARVLVSGLTAITNASSGSSTSAMWRLWRSVDGGSSWNLMGTGLYSTDTFTDTGAGGDCTVNPPTTGTTVGTNKLTVTVPVTSQPAEATFFSVYADTTGQFLSPSLLGTYPVSDFGVSKTYTALTLLAGAPPAVSRCYPGANKIDPDTDILDWPWKLPVANTAALPALGNTDGDIRATLDNHHLNIWTGSAWEDLPVTGGGGGGGSATGSALGVLQVQGPTAVALGASTTTHVTITVPTWAEQISRRIVVAVAITHAHPDQLAATITSSQGTAVRLFVAGSFATFPAMVGYAPQPLDPDNLLYFTDSVANFDLHDWQPVLQLTSGSDLPAFASTQYQPVDNFNALIGDGDVAGTWDLAITDTSGTTGTLENVILYFPSREFEALISAPPPILTGSAIIADGATIAHGLPYIPQFVQVTGTVAGQIATVNASSVGLTTFAVDIKTGGGSAGTTQKIYWSAK